MTRFRNVTLATAIAAMAVFAAGTVARAQQDHTHPMENSQSTNTMTDQEFLTKAAQADVAEIKLGQLAEQKGGTATVRDFGKRMVHDHSQNLDLLKQTAERENITLPTEPDREQMATYDKLDKLSSSAFDKDYSRDMVNDHTKDVRAFKQEAADARNEAVKSYASETVPVLEEHLKLAHQMARDVWGKQASGTSGSYR
jgi:putative membrane protein